MRTPLVRALALVVVMGCFVGCFVGCASPAKRQERAATAARTQATAMYEAFLHDDLQTFVAYTHPKAAEAIGGPKKLIESLQTLKASLRANGLAPKSATISPVKQIVAMPPDGYQAILPTELVFDKNGLSLHQPSFLFGLSTDAGKTWKFTDAGRLGGEALRKLFPECSPQLEIPPRPATYQSGN